MGNYFGWLKAITVSLTKITDFEAVLQHEGTLDLLLSIGVKERGNWMTTKSQDKIRAVEMAGEVLQLWADITMMYQ